MPTSVSGHFYLRLTSNGNLTGEFSNKYSNVSHTESADRFTEVPLDLGSPEAFVGEYYSTWHEREEPGEGNHIAILAHLTITKKRGAQKFELSWMGIGVGAPRFHGEAILGEGLLVGNYVQGS